MTSKRMPLALVLSAMLFVTAGFAATKKFQRDDGARDWSDLSLQNDSSPQNHWSLQNGDLQDLGSSVSGGVGNLTLSQGGGPLGPPILAFGSADNWLGGFGNWSNAGLWSAGLPGANSDVTIDSGGFDHVTLDISSSINSLTLGGSSGCCGQLEIDNAAETLTITHGLTVGQSGALLMNAGMVTIGGDVNNNNGIGIWNGSTVSVAGDFNDFNHLDMSGAGSAVLTITGALNNTAGAEVDLGPGKTITTGSLSNSGNVSINGGTLTVNAGGSLTNSNYVEVDSGGKLTINGAVTNSGQLFTNDQDNGGGNTITVNGLLTNQATGQIRIEGDSDNDGRPDALHVNGNFDNSGLLSTGDRGGGNTITITGTLTNNSGASFVMNGPGDTATIGSVVNNGLIDLENGSALTVTGNVSNSANIYASEMGGSGHNTITIDGTLTEIGSGQVVLYNPTDMLILSGGGGLNLSGGASISTPTLNNSGTINIDKQSMLLVGMRHGAGDPITNYTQLSNGTLGEVITPNSFGVINLNGGSALLAGTLDVMLQAGFNPAVGKTYQFFIGVGQLNGTFDTIENDIFNNGTEKWLVDYDGADGYVELIAEQNGAPVPEPATLLVLIPGLLGMGYGLRRKLCR